jgi:hypothetical protein
VNQGPRIARAFFLLLFSFFPVILSEASGAREGPRRTTE